MTSGTGPLEGVAVPLSQFMQLTKIPIVIYFGDNIPEQPTANPGQDNWRVRLAMARLFRECRAPADAPGSCRRNTHFAFSDLNNLEIADLMSKFLQQKKLD